MSGMPAPRPVLLHAGECRLCRFPARVLARLGEAVVAVGVAEGRVEALAVVLAIEEAGIEVAEVGAGVSEFRVGDRVFGASVFGANAEFVCGRESGPIAHMPAGMSFEEAAAVSYGAILALNTMSPVTVGFSPHRAQLGSLRTRSLRHSSSRAS